MVLKVERVPSADLPAGTRAQLAELLDEAYGGDLTTYLGDIGPGIHLLGWDGPSLVSHLMWVERTLYLDCREPVASAYVELVATRSTRQRQGLATGLMTRLAREIQDFPLGALSPSEPVFYRRLGWEEWRGPLFVRTSGGLEATPDEVIMVLQHEASPAIDLAASLAVDWRPGEVW